MERIEKDVALKEKERLDDIRQEQRKQKQTQLNNPSRKANYGIQGRVAGAIIDRDTGLATAVQKRQQMWDIARDGFQEAETGVLDLQQQKTEKRIGKIISDEPLLQSTGSISLPPE